MEAEWRRAGGVEPEPARPLADLEVAAPLASYEHQPPPPFEPGQALTIALRIRARDGDSQPAVELHYRRVNQAETYAVQPMLCVADDCFEAAIPAAATDSPFPCSTSSCYGVVERPGVTRTWRPISPIKRISWCGRSGACQALLAHDGFSSQRGQLKRAVALRLQPAIGHSY